MKSLFQSELAAEVYDIDAPSGRSFGDVEFYSERLKSCTGRILEPAVGTGRILIPLLEAGLTVDGMDNSSHMLAVCGKRCAERGLNPALHEGDMRAFSLPHKYEAIIIPASSFLMLEKREDSLDALKCFHEHLIPDGRLILDIELRADFGINHVGPDGTWNTPEGDVITLESRLVEVDFLNQYTVQHLKYEKWHDGKLVRAELQRFAMRWYGIEEFKLVLESVGFSKISISADYARGRREPSADQMFTFEARRI